MTDPKQENRPWDTDPSRRSAHHSQRACQRVQGVSFGLGLTVSSCPVREFVVLETYMRYSMFFTFKRPPFSSTAHLREPRTVISFSLQGSSAAYRCLLVTPLSAKDASSSF